jgi:hypothetical protein
MDDIFIAQILSNDHGTPIPPARKDRRHQLRIGAQMLGGGGMAETTPSGQRFTDEEITRASEDGPASRATRMAQQQLELWQLELWQQPEQARPAQAPTEALEMNWAAESSFASTGPGSVAAPCAWLSAGSAKRRATAKRNTRMKDAQLMIASPVDIHPGDGETGLNHGKRRPAQEFNWNRLTFSRSRR